MEPCEVVDGDSSNPKSAKGGEDAEDRGHSQNAPGEFNIRHSPAKGREAVYLSGQGYIGGRD